MTTGYQPSHDIDRFDFSKDLAYGQEGEDAIREFLTALGLGNFEVKRDRYRNGNMVVETEQNPRHSGWKPSGINVTTAHWWVYMYSLSGFVIISVPRLKKFLEKNKDYLPIKDLAPNSDNPARGYLLYPQYVMDLLTNEEYDG
jgi:hypothetical protein